MSNADTFTLGVPRYLVDNDNMGTLPWKLNKKKLILKGQRSTATLTFKKLSNRLVEPWQRVGFWLNVELKVAVPAAARILGLKPGAPILSSYLRPPTGRNPIVTHSWNTHDETHEALAEAVGQRIQPVIDSLARAVDHEVGFEAVAWTAVKESINAEGLEVDWDTPPPIETRAFPVSLAIESGEEVAVYYAAALLLRKQHECARRFLAEMKRRGTSAGLRPEIWDAVDREIAAQEKRGDQPRPMADLDWDFEALNAEVAAADRAHAAPAPVEVAAPACAPPPPGSPWEVLESAVRPVEFHSEGDGLGFDPPADLEWEALCAGLDRLPAAEQASFADHAGRLDAALSKIPDAHRRAPERWMDGLAQAPPAGWPLVRSLTVDDETSIDAAHTGAIRHLFMYDAAHSARAGELELPGVTAAEFSWTELTLAGVEALAAALPALRSVKADIPDAELVKIARSPVAERFAGITSTSPGSFDKGVKALARRKDLARLRALHLNNDVKAPAIKAMLKSAWAPQLEALTIGRSSPAGGRALLDGLVERLAGLRELTLGFGEELEETRLPPRLERLAIQPGEGSFEQWVGNNPRTPLRRLALDGYGIEPPVARGLARWPAMAGLEEIAITVYQSDDSPYQAFFGLLAEGDWGALRSISLQLYEPDDSAFEGLAGWVARCPKLRSLQIQAHQPTISTDGAQTLAAAAAHQLRYLAVEVPAMLEALAAQAWPQLVTLQLKLAAATSELSTPIRAATLRALETQMPRLRIAALEDGELDADAEGVADDLRASPHLLLLKL